MKSARSQAQSASSMTIVQPGASLSHLPPTTNLPTNGNSAFTFPSNPPADSEFSFNSPPSMLSLNDPLTTGSSERVLRSAVTRAPNDSRGQTSMVPNQKGGTSKVRSRKGQTPLDAFEVKPGTTPEPTKNPAKWVHDLTDIAG